VKLSKQSKAAAGWALILAGIAGVLLPVLPGIPFLLAGLVVLSSQYAWSRRLLEFLPCKFSAASRHNANAPTTTPTSQLPADKLSALTPNAACDSALNARNDAARFKL
jgi:hypothetical protein